jgi:hypothetical protein
VNSYRTPPRPQTLMGMKVIVRDDMTIELPRFPDKKWSKRRYRRMVGKHGSWTYHKPVAYRVGPSIICHPKLYAELIRRSGATE